MLFQNQVLWNLKQASQVIRSSQTPVTNHRSAVCVLGLTFVIDSFAHTHFCTLPHSDSAPQTNMIMQSSDFHHTDHVTDFLPHGEAKGIDFQLVCAELQFRNAAFEKTFGMKNCQAF